MGVFLNSHVKCTVGHSGTDTRQDHRRNSPIRGVIEKDMKIEVLIISNTSQMPGDKRSSYSIGLFNSSETRPVRRKPQGNRVMILTPFSTP